MQAPKVNRIINIENPSIFHMIKEVIKKNNATNKEISPETFYSLVVDTTPTNNAPPSWAPQRMAKHVVANFIIFSTPITANS